MSKIVSVALVCPLSTTEVPNVRFVAPNNIRFNTRAEFVTGSSMMPTVKVFTLTSPSTQFNTPVVLV